MIAKEREHSYGDLRDAVIAVMLDAGDRDAIANSREVAAVGATRLGVAQEPEKLALRRDAEHDAGR